MPGLCSRFTTSKKVNAELFEAAHKGVARGQFLDQVR